MADISITNNNWISQFNPVEQQQIAQAMGYNSPSDIPSGGVISSAAIVEMMNTLPASLSSRVLDAMGVSAADPELEEADVDRNEFTDRLLRIMVLMCLIEELQTANAKDSLELKREQIKEKTDERLEKLEESLEKMKKAERSSLLMKIFGWVAMAIALVVSAVVLGAAVVASHGAATPIAVAAIALMITAFSTAIMVMEETGAMEKTLTAMFGDNDKAKMGFRIGLQIALVIASICTLGAGMASAVGNTASAATATAAKAVQVATSTAKTAQVGVQVANQVVSGASKFAQIAVKLKEVFTLIASKIKDAILMIQKNAETIQKVASGINATTTAAQAVGTGVNAWYQYDAAMARADVIDIEALLALLEQLMQEFLEFYQNAVETTENAKGKLGDAMTAYQNATMSIFGTTGA